MGDDSGRLRWAVIEQGEVRVIRSDVFQGRCDCWWVREIVMCLQAGECGQPMQAEVSQE